MKQLILATALAFAVTTLGAMPAAATAPDIVTQAGAGTDPMDPSDDPAADSSGASAGGPYGTSASANTAGAGADVSGAGAEGAEADTDTTASQGESEGGVSGTTDPSTPAEADTEGTGETDGTPDESPEAEPIAASLSLAADEVTVEDIGNPDVGLRFVVDGVLAGDSIGWGEGDGIHDTVTADGTFTGTFYTAQKVSPGDTVTVTVDIQRGGQNASYSATATVVAGGGGTESSNTTTLDVTPATQQLDDFLGNGVTVMMTGCRADSEVNIAITTKYDPDTVVFEANRAAGDGAATVVTWVPEVGDTAREAFIGDYLVRADCGDQYQDGSFAVTADGEAALAPTLWVQPETISGADFVNRDKGVILSVKDCVADSVRFRVWGGNPRKVLYDQTADNDGSGLVAAQVYGLENTPAAYVGTYEVVADCGGTELMGKFTVTAAGSGDVRDANDAGALPRTGAELTGLGAGAVLILAGAAAVLFARRRAQLRH